MDNDAARVLVFGLRSLSGIDGGVETHARELYPRLAGLGFRITVLTRSRYTKAKSSASESLCDERVAEMPLWAPRVGGLEALVHSAMAAVYCLFSRPDIVHVHGIGPALFVPLMRLRRLRIIFTHHGKDYEATKWGGPARMVLRIGERLGTRFAHRVICVSRYLREDLHERLGVRATTVYNGMPTVGTIQPPTAASLRDLNTVTYVLMVGRVTAHKRIEDVIEAVTGLQKADLKLVICGTGPANDSYVQSIRKLAENNNRVVLTGFVSPDDLPWLYAHAHCTVMASSYEGMPLAVLEALSYGSPIALSRIPAHDELELPSECYFQLGEIEEIRAAIGRFRVPHRGGDANMAGAVVDDRFNWDKIAVQTAAVFRDEDRHPNSRITAG